MRTFDSHWLMAGVAKEMHRVAMLGVSTGNNVWSKRYLETCKGFHQPTGTHIMFSRDSGHHSCGWWKNPDYEHCFHLSLSFWDLETMISRGRDPDLTKAWLDAFYGDNKRLLWAEPPYSQQGKQCDVWHYRLFVHDDWKTSLLPRGEVYSREFTEAGWKSWSDVQAELQQRSDRLVEILGNELSNS